MSIDYLYIASDNRVLVTVTDAVSGDVVSAATVTMSVTDSGGTAVSGGTDISLTESPGTAGEYIGIIEDAVAALLTSEDFYWVTLTIVSGSSRLISRYNPQAIYHPS